MNSLFQNHEKICNEIQLFDNTYHISYEIFVKKCSSWLKIIYKLGKKKKQKEEAVQCIDQQLVIYNFNRTLTF